MIATIDIGTNSTRLLIAETKTVAGGTAIEPVRTELRITRLGQGVNASGNLNLEALARTYQVLAEYHEIITNYPVEKVIATATSAVRDAANQREFLEQVKKRTGWDVRVLTGQEEAQASFLGACRAVQSGDVLLADELLVIDIGGGSTELILGRVDGELMFSGSSQVGAVRMTELCISQNPIPDHELECLRNTVADRLSPLVQRCCSKTQKTPPLVGVGGTITTLAALELELTQYDPARITGYRLTKSCIAEWFHRLSRMTVAERSALPGIAPGRSDIIPAGAGICCVLMDLLQADQLIVSDGDLMQGIWYLEGFV